MSQTIWKIPLLPTVTQTIKIPLGAVALSAQLQNHVPTIWYQCDRDAPMGEREIIIVPTGSDAPHFRDAKFIDTVQLDSGKYVVHIFEKLP